MLGWIKKTSLHRAYVSFCLSTFSPSVSFALWATICLQTVVKSRVDSSELNRGRENRIPGVSRKSRRAEWDAGIRLRTRELVSSYRLLLRSTGKVIFVMGHSVPFHLPLSGFILVIIPRLIPWQCNSVLNRLKLSFRPRLKIVQNISKSSEMFCFSLGISKRVFISSRSR